MKWIKKVLLISFLVACPLLQADLINSTTPPDAQPKSQSCQNFACFDFGHKETGDSPDIRDQLREFLSVSVPASNLSAFGVLDTGGSEQSNDLAVAFSGGLNDKNRPHGDGNGHGHGPDPRAAVPEQSATIFLLVPTIVSVVVFKRSHGL